MAVLLLERKCISDGNLGFHHTRACYAASTNAASTRAVAALMADLPLKKLRNFGGKLGAEPAELGCSTAGQVGSGRFDS